MKALRKLICCACAAATLFSGTALSAPAALAAQITPRPDNGKIRSKISDVTDFLHIERLDIRFDDRLNDVVDEIYKDSNFDVRVYTENVPDFLWLSRSVSRRLNYPVDKMQKKLNDYSDNLKKASKPDLAKYIKLISVSLGKVETIYIRSIPTSKSGVYDLALELIYFDGSSEQLPIRCTYNSKTGVISSDNGKGVLGLGYEMDTKNFVLFTPVDVWMRSMGFCRMYDIGANYIFHTMYDYETVRIKFEYDNRDWMIQLWKGKYYVTNGSEIGIYTKPKYRLSGFYNCASDEDLMKMSLKVYHDDELLISREEQYHWWINGFSLDKEYYDGTDLTVKGTIQMKDKEMLKAFRAALDKRSDEIKYSVKGLTVSLSW